MRVYVTNGPRNGLILGRKVYPCPGSRRRWVLGRVHASSQVVHAANTYRPRFQVRARPSYSAYCHRRRTRGPSTRRTTPTLIPAGGGRRTRWRRS